MTEFRSFLPYLKARRGPRRTRRLSEREGWRQFNRDQAAMGRVLLMRVRIEAALLQTSEPRNDR